MLYRLKAEVRRLRLFLLRQRDRGNGLVRSQALRLPATIIRKLYLRGARALNGRVLNPYVNEPRFRSFERRRGEVDSPRFFLIVMPNVLHFLLPCLRLIPRDVDLTLVYNGARAWERDYLPDPLPGTGRLQAENASRLQHHPRRRVDVAAAS